MDDLIIIILTLAFTILAAVNQNKKKKKPVPGQAPEPDFWKMLIPGNQEDDVFGPVAEGEKEPVLRREATPRQDPFQQGESPVRPGSQEGAAYRVPPREEGSSVLTGKIPAPAYRKSNPPDPGRQRQAQAGPAPKRGTFTGEAHESFSSEGHRNENLVSATPRESLQEEMDHPPFMDDFSLQKAVIYREILDPKYF